MGSALRIWVLTDGRAGNEAQALGLAEALARARPAMVDVRRIALTRWAAAMTPRLTWRLSGLVRDWPLMGLARGREGLVPPWPDLVIGAGRRSAPVVAALRRAHGMAAVQLLDPQMDPRAFDAVVVPAHDRLDGANVITSVGALNRVTPDRVAAEAEAWRVRLAHLPSPRVAVMIGGPSASASFPPADQSTLRVALSALAATHGLMITTSRRTPAELVEALKDIDGAFVWTGDGDNPYPAMLGLADAALVTEDSVNMASEAATAGLPTHIFALHRVAPKIARFHEALEAHGASRRFTGQIGTWAYPPLAEADRIAEQMIRWRLA